MWPFGKSSKTEEAVAVMPDAIEFASEKWLFFTSKLIFKEDVPLIDRIGAFMVPAQQGIETNFKSLRNAPDDIVLLVIAMGVWKSGTHTREEIENALGLSLPEQPDK